MLWEVCKIYDNYFAKKLIFFNIGHLKSSIKLDIIQKWCETLATIHWTLRDQMKSLISTRQQLQINDQQIHDYLPEILCEVTKLLENLIVRSFVIEKQPPQVIGIKKK